MSYSFTTSETVTFTVTHARHIAAKVAADLKRLQRFYGQPSDGRIADYEAEIVALLKGGYLERVTYGFKRNGMWIEPSLRYTAQDLVGAVGADDDPGRIRPGADVGGASFGSFLAYSDAWFALTYAEREAFERVMPFSRSESAEPGVDGYLSADRVYSAGGRALNRATVRGY